LINILDGKKVAEHLKVDLKARIDKRKAMHMRPPGLAVVLVGNNPASQLYVRHNHLGCEAVGIRSFSHYLPENIEESALLALVDELNDNTQVDGILIQLPLPAHIDPNLILERIVPQKDVDGLHPYNLGRLAQRRPLLSPCTPHGIITLLKAYDIPIESMETVVVGASNIVGRPMVLELLLEKATVTICHRFTKNLQQEVSRAELLIAAIGKSGIIQTDWIKKGAVVIDVGTNRLPNGRLVGDIDFDSAQFRASWITPVPGGVGPMTIATLLENTWLASTL
jgi:methylenetetrahydrofolate dehydrogenase (NADP+)/methenyltetrahydrofolate cyclohydrolase